MYLFDAKSFTDLWYLIKWFRFYDQDHDLFETEETFCNKTKRRVMWVWLKGVEEPLND
jgi:hypothetical protein